MRRGAVLGGLGAVLLVVAAATVLRRDGGGGTTALGAADMTEPASAAIDSFFRRYVAEDGRVVRHDEGGDTVSEGQAYAMLLAAAAGDRARFEAVWGWTKAELQRPDGLLSWKWRDGSVVDDSPATDADLDSARALVMAGRRFGNEDWVAEGARIGKSVLDNETVDAKGGHLVLLAGPWARTDAVVNPSYVSPCTYRELAGVDRDPRWERLERTGYTMVDSLLAGGRLPPDWARSGRDGGQVRPTGPPDRAGAAPRYGLDAARLPFRLAEACDERGPELAARLWPRLRDLDGRGAAVAYSLDGDRLDGSDNPLGLVAAAAAARAAGEERQADHLLAEAAALERRHSTYYGAAWVALGHALLRPAKAGDSR